VPVATEKVFRQYWPRASEALGLKWVPLFETGIPLDTADVPDVLAELCALQTWTEQSSPDCAQRIGARLQELIRELSALEGNLTQVELFIG
jgi:hypothetical protein